MAKDYFWRTQSTSYIYVDSDTGDDINGLGTMKSPYQTLGKAWRAQNTKPANIVCRGFFQEDMADGNHAANIQGDYPGAAVFDGDNIFTIYGFNLNNLIVNNCIPGKQEGVNVFSGSPLFAGVGRATGASYVGNAAADTLLGLSGSRGIIGNSGCYWGLVGGSGSYNGIFYPKCNDTYGLFFFGYNKPSQWSIIGVKKEDRAITKQPTGGPNGFIRSIFADCAFYIGDHLAFENCYFGSDCTWWDSNTGEQIILEGNTSEEKIAFLESKMAELGASNTNCSFKDCVFLDIPGEEIFNNPQVGDLSTKISANISPTIGCLPPCLNIPIKAKESIGDSVSSMWDPETATEGIEIKDGEIALAEDFSNLPVNSIETGVIEIDPTKLSINALYSAIASHFGQGALINNKNVLGETYTPGQTLPQGKYKVSKGNIDFNYTSYFEGDIITVTTDGLSFTKSTGYSDEAELVAIEDVDLKVVVEIRVFPNLLGITSSRTHTLEEGKTYLIMESASSIALNTGRKLYKGSIIDAKSGDIINASEDIKVGILNNIVYPKWVPILPWGEIFISRKGTTIDVDSEGNALTSANDNSYKANNQGGNLNNVTKVDIRYQYSQFKITIITC